MLKFVAALLLVCAHASGRPQAEVDPHIVGGEPVQGDCYPFTVSLRHANGNFFCGGALISQRYVLTAAHCVQSVRGPDQIKIGMGSLKLSEQKLHKAEKFIIHPDYKPPAFYNDIALIKLQEPVTNKSMKFIELHEEGNVDNQQVTAVGWGYTSVNGPISEILLRLKRPILPASECNNRFPEFPQGLHEGQICLGSNQGHGMCFGDSGSPLIYEANNKTITVGVVSWGIPCAKGYPDVFARVSTYVDWIRKNSL